MRVSVSEYLVFWEEDRITDSGVRKRFLCLMMGKGNCPQQTAKRKRGTLKMARLREADKKKKMR